MSGMGMGMGMGMGGSGHGLGDIGSSGSAKIEGHVKFPLVFDIRPYLTEEMQGTVKSMLCRLFAVIVHSGKNSHSGHYVSYVRNVAKNEWWKMDDAKVMLVPKEEVFAAEAYMLFYRVVDHPVSVELKNKEEEIFKREAELEAVEKAKAAMASASNTNADDTDSVADAFAQATATTATTTTSSTSMTTPSPSSTSNANITNANANIANANITNSTNANAANKKRKRDTPEFKSGEEWARKITNKPKSMLHFIRAAQDYLCEKIEFKPEYMDMMKEEVESGNKVQNGPSFGISLKEDVSVDNFEMLDGFRHALWTMFKTILPTEQNELEELFKPKEKKVNGNGNGNGGSRTSSDNATNATDATNAASGNNNANASKSEPLAIPVVEHNEHLI